MALAALEMVQDKQVEKFLTQSLKAVMQHVDLSRTAASLLSGLTSGGRHQEVLDDVLARRIARAHGWMRTGARIRERITQLADRHCHTTQEGNSTFYWPASLNERQQLVFRPPANDEHVRPVDEISLPELMALARELRATGVQEDALLAEMARALGLQQLRAASRARLEQARQHG